MVEFTSAPLSDPRITPQIKAQFIKVAQLFNWKLTDASGTYKGLIVVGDIAVNNGLSTMISTFIDVSPGPGIPIAKFNEITQIVNAELRQSSIVVMRATNR
jgi:hypothetical protein